MHTSQLKELDVNQAAEVLRTVVLKTPLQFHGKLSAKFGCEVYLKREDLQVVRSYKIRGAFNLMQSLDAHQRNAGVVCASAGNHAQGVALSCKLLNVHGIIYMPSIVPRQKVNQVRMFGGQHISIVLVGDTFDECQEHALKDARDNGRTFVPPFDHPKVIEGQATVIKEVLDELSEIDFVFVPVGGGGLCAGIGHYLKTYSPKTKVIGVEPQGAPSMTEALKAGKPITLDTIQSFVDGPSVKRVGEYTFEICRDVLAGMLLVAEGKVS